MNAKLTDPPARKGQMAGPRLRVGKILERIALQLNATTKLGQNSNSQHLFRFHVQRVDMACTGALRARILST